MDVAGLIARIRSEIGDNAIPFRSTIQGDGLASWFDLIQPNFNPTGFSVTRVSGATVTLLTGGTDYTADGIHGQVTFAVPPAVGDLVLVTGTSYGMLNDNDLLTPIRDAVIWHCHNRKMTERRKEAHGFITYPNTPINLRNLPSVEELPLTVLCTHNVYWMIADDMALDVNVSTAESTNIDRVARYNQVMRHIMELDARYRELCQQFNIGPYRMQTLNLRRVSQQTGRLVPLFRPREIDDHAYPTRLIPPIDSVYEDNSGVPTQLAYGSGV